MTNAYGIPTYDYEKTTDSVGPGNPHQCQFDSDCGYSWHCIKGSGIYGTCMR